MSWVLTIAGFAVLIIIHEFGHFVAAKATGMRVERFFLFFPPKLVSVRRGETEYGIGALPFGGFVKITGMNPDEELPPDIAPRAYYHQPVWKRIVVIAAGPAMNVLLAFAILFVLSLGLRNVNATVGSISPGTPAATHLQPGDRILAVDGRSFPNASTSEQLRRFVHLVAQHRCPGKQTDGCRAKTPVHLRIERDGHVRALTITPVYDADIDRTRIGISDVTHQAVEFGAREALTLIALISLSLAIINLFPFLPLDGGHIFWSLVEKVRGRPVPFSIMERAGAIGFVLVLILFTVGLTNDIDRLTNGGFNTH